MTSFKFMKLFSPAAFFLHYSTVAQTSFKLMKYLNTIFATKLLQAFITGNQIQSSVFGLTRLPLKVEKLPDFGVAIFCS